MLVSCRRRRKVSGGSCASLKIRWRAALRLAAGDEGLQGFQPFRLDRRSHEMFEPLFIEAMGGIIGGRRTGFAPALVIAPVGDHRREKGVAIAGLRMGGAKEMAARANFAHRLDRQFAFV